MSVDSATYTPESRDFENPLCIVSQEWTYGIDNTGTRFSDAGDLKITLDDGRCLTWEQTPTGGWSAQLIQWAAGIQVAADELGLQWLVEPRFVDNPNPSNIDGTINGPGGTPSGLPGAPDAIIAQALIDGGMAWRYVNIQICPGEPVPVRAERITSTEGRPVPYDLTTAGAVLGPKNRFRVFYERDKVTNEPCETWYIYDLGRPDPRKRWREANAGEIPFCFFKDGDAASTAQPPEKTCTFRFSEGCDNNDSTNQADFTTGIIRRVSFCEGQKLKREFFIEDPNDPTGLLDYTMNGRFVDCASGEVIPVPPPPCDTAAYAGQVWRVKPGAELLTTVDYWGGPNYPAGQTSAPHDNVSNIFAVSADGRTLEHVNGAPSITFTADFTDIRTSNTNFIEAVQAGDRTGTNGNDQIRVRGYIVLQGPARLRDVNPNTGERGGLWINRCCAGVLELLAEDTTDSAGSDTGIFNGVVVPAGIHYLEAVTSDLSAWQGFQLDASFDDGATYAPLKFYDSKPEYECVTLFRCEPSGTLIERATGNVYEEGQDDLECQPPACLANAASDAPAAQIDEQTLADAIVAKQRDVIPRVESWVNEGDDVVLTDGAGNPYLPGTLGTLVSVTDFGTGFVRWSLDGSSPTGGDAAEYTTSGPYHSALNLDGVDLSLVRLNGSSANSDFSAAWEVYK